MITSIFKLWIDFDGVFVDDIPDIKMSDEEYIAKITATPILKPSKRLVQLMEKTSWYVITGRKSHLDSVTEAQLKRSVSKACMRNFKGFYFNDTGILNYRFKYNKCFELGIGLFIESDKWQVSRISEFLTCIHYESK